MAWKNNSLVRIRKESFEKTGKRDKKRLIELFSIMYESGYLQTWIQYFIIILNMK